LPPRIRLTGRRPGRVVSVVLTLLLNVVLRACSG
jgi:hypothetical protein